MRKHHPGKESLAEEYLRVIGRFSREINAGRPELDTVEAFWGVAASLQGLRITKRTASIVIPRLMEAALEEASWLGIANSLAVKAAMRKLGRRWLEDYIAKELLWEMTFVHGRPLVAHPPIIRAIEAIDFRSLADFGNEVLVGLQKVGGVDVRRLYAEANGINPDAEFQLVLNAKQHSVDCCCLACQVTEDIGNLWREGKLPEIYLSNLLAYCLVVSDRVAEDEEALAIMTGELRETLSFFTTRAVLMSGELNAELLLRVAENVFRRRDVWPKFVVEFLTRYSMPGMLDNWSRRSGWVYTGIEDRQIMRSDLAKTLELPDELRIADESVDLNDLLAHLREGEQSGGSSEASN